MKKGIEMSCRKQIKDYVDSDILIIYDVCLEETKKRINKEIGQSYCKQIILKILEEELG